VISVVKIGHQVWRLAVNGVVVSYELSKRNCLVKIEKMVREGTIVVS